jgi:DNA-binding HxlR family transcriptional regulator
LSDTHTLVPTRDDAHADCRALTDVLARIGDKWTVMVVGVLSQGPMRYSQILKVIDGISQRMLTLTLRASSAMVSSRARCIRRTRRASTIR